METFAPKVRGTVVEYGAGLGTVSERLVPLAEKLIVVEPLPALAECLNARFAGEPRVEVVAQTLELHAQNTEADTFDTVVLVNVLEHIQDDEAALGHLTRILRPGGHLLIFVPALRFLMSKLDLKLGHHRRYDKRELLTKIKCAGATPLMCRYFDLVGVATWFFPNTLFGFTSFNLTLLRLNDRIIVPISRALERVAPPPIGKNLILIASKPS